ncbi:MAG: prolipoprotein diacylglyceryl transferase [Oscillospiraceae bacterium]|nr:prolipoprotein diacylglyceryl transferase [Oscillospiraceae bacterium]
MTLKNTIEFPNLFGDGIIISAGRVAFTLPIVGLEVYWYGVIITTAVALGILYGINRASKVGLLPDNVFEIAFWGVITGVVGARAYYVLFNGGGMSLQDAVTGIRGGGLAIYGGLIGAVAGGGIAARVKKVKFAPLADLIGLGFLIGHSIGRWGNFFNQEAFGAPTASSLPWGMTGNLIRADSQVAAMQRSLGNSGYALVHPCFLYESLWCLVGFVVLHFYMKRRSFDGEVFLLYVVWYGTGRAFIESLRTDSLMAGGLRVSQVLAIVSAVAALGLFVYFKVKVKNSGKALFKDTDASREAVAAYDYKIRLEKEKIAAKNEIVKHQREMTDPFRDDEEDDDDDS